VAKRKAYTRAFPLRPAQREKSKGTGLKALGLKRPYPFAPCALRLAPCEKIKATKYKEYIFQKTKPLSKDIL
jgi:hypothetical protein